MSAYTTYTCNLCDKSSTDPGEFNSGPGNKLINSWNPDSLGGAYARLKHKHYCEGCILTLNKAINAIFEQRDLVSENSPTK